MQYASRLPQPGRTVLVPLLAAALGAGVATATFALVNIEDNPDLSLSVVQTAPPADAVAGQRNDSGPTEGASQQIMAPAATPSNTAPRYDGGPDEGVSGAAIADANAPDATAATLGLRYDGGPSEGSSAGAIAEP